MTTADLWAAVDALTKPTSRRVDRERLDDEGWMRGPLLCDVAAYRAVIVSHGVIPSLWGQAVEALFGGEVGGTGSKPFRERSPADLDLMEIMSIIREHTRHELRERGHRTRKGPDGLDVEFHPDEIRSLASMVIQTDAPDGLWWWEYRFAQWARLLEGYLHATERTVKPIHLRNTACPRCSVRQVVSEDDDGEGAKVVPSLVIDFASGGYVRAAECLHCGAAWFRGTELEALARQINAIPAAC